jgi:hypothetical protein
VNGQSLHELILVWIREVFTQAEEVDPKSDHYWESLAYGWALGHGLTVIEAGDFVRQLNLRNLL